MDECIDEWTDGWLNEEGEKNCYVTMITKQSLAGGLLLPLLP